MQIEGRTIAQRKAAGAALLTKTRLAARERTACTWTVGRIGGFDLTCAIQPTPRNGRPEPELVLKRTDFMQPIGVDDETTQIGIIARLEHALDRMDGELGRASPPRHRCEGPAGRLGHSGQSAGPWTFPSCR
jgi:hypothetical protein